MTHSREKLGLALGIAGVLLFGGTLPATRLMALWVARADGGPDV